MRPVGLAAPNDAGWLGGRRSRRLRVTGRRRVAIGGGETLAEAIARRGSPGRTGCCSVARWNHLYGG